MTNLDSILKSRDITLPTKVHLVKVMVFPVVMYGNESQTIKKAECGRIDAFELWCWRRLLRVSWTARRSNQSILNNLSPGYSLEGLMLKLKLQYFGHLMWRNSLERPWCWERLKAKEEKGMTEGRDGRMASLTLQTRVWASSSDGDGQWSLACCSPWGCKELDMTERLNWTELSVCRYFSSVQSLHRVWLFVTPWSAACQVSLSFSNSRSLLKLIYICIWVYMYIHMYICIWVYSYQFSSVAQLRLTRMLTNNLCNKFNHIDEI